MGRQGGGPHQMGGRSTASRDGGLWARARACAGSYRGEGRGDVSHRGGRDQILGLRSLGRGEGWRRCLREGESQPGLQPAAHLPQRHPGLLTLLWVVPKTGHCSPKTQCFVVGCPAAVCQTQSPVGGRHRVLQGSGGWWPSQGRGAHASPAEVLRVMAGSAPTRASPGAHTTSPVPPCSWTGC